MISENDYKIIRDVTKNRCKMQTEHYLGYNYMLLLLLF